MLVPPAPSSALRIVHPDARYGRVRLVEPTTHGYIYIAGTVKPGPLPVVLPNPERAQLTLRLCELARQLAELDTVVTAHVFRALVRPPTARFSEYLQQRLQSARGVKLATFDVLILIETTSPAAAHELQRTPAYAGLVQAVEQHARDLYVMVGRNARRIHDVDTTRQGLFLFNHFVADDREVMLELWEYLASWYMVETGLRNSVAMVPLDGAPADYAIVNFARWEVGLLRHFWNQLSKQSFWRYVTANLDANHAASLPVYCRLA
jgi:hypothetical protein